MIREGLAAYVGEVTERTFPAPANWFGMKDEEYDELVSAARLSRDPSRPPRRARRTRGDGRDHDGAHEPDPDLRDRLAIPGSRLDDLNAFLLDPDARIVNDLLAVVARYGTPEEINRKAREAGALPALLDRVRETQPDYLADLEWLEEQRERGAFVSVADYRRGVLGDRADTMTFRDDMAVTLEVSSLQYFPWVIAAARRAMADQDADAGALDPRPQDEGAGGRRATCRPSRRR